MPDPETLRRVKKDQREGKAPSTQAGEFIREEVKHVREGKHGARSTKQAIAIGLSKARRAGVPLGTPKRASPRVKRQAQRDTEKGQHRGGRRVSAKRSAASEHALEQEPRRAASHRALSRQARGAASRRTRASRSASAKKAAQTRKKRARPHPRRRLGEATPPQPRLVVLHDPHVVTAPGEGTPLRSAVSMLDFYLHRAGRRLPRAQRDALERAKHELRELYGRAGR